MLASLGEKRSWWRFGGNGASESPSANGSGDDDRITHSMLGALASRAGAAPRVEESEPDVRSMLSLSAGGGPVGAAGDAGEEEDSDPLRPLTSHSTLGELAGLEEHESSPFPIERFILVSLLAHVLLLILLLVLPARLPSGANGDLFAGLVPQPRDDSPIPINFADLPGPARPNPKRSPLSDADRRAGGGDPSRPKSASPFVPEKDGVAGLAPGPKAPRVPGSDVPVRPGAKAEAQREAAAQPQQPAGANQKPSEFPSQRSPSNSATSGPGENRLAGLDSAIKEAARGAVGGEGGSPTGNPEGGFVDSGPLSFDSSWYDFGPYAAEMIRRIKLHWDVPELARLGWKGTVTIRFYILENGTVADAKILRGSGIPPFDFAAFQAIVKSSPFRPLPQDLHETREGVTVTFFYNLRPESTEEAPAGAPKKGGAR